MAVFHDLSNAILQSSGLPKALTPIQAIDFIFGRLSIQIDRRTFLWSALPKITYEIPSASADSIFKLVLGPYHFIQPKEQGFYQMLIFGEHAIPFFSAFFDRDAGTFGFALGCRCDASYDTYPWILISNGLDETFNASTSKKSND